MDRSDHGRVDHNHLEPDTWEAMHLTYALHALVAGRYFAAFEFAGMVLTDPRLRRPPRLLPGGPPPVTLTDLRDAMEQIRARPAAG